MRTYPVHTLLLSFISFVFERSVALQLTSQRKESSTFLQKNDLRRAPPPHDVYPANRVKNGVYYQMLEETHIEAKASAECICPLGEFWHWRIRQCIKQAPWGYECGFFPKEHWHRVCQDGLKCSALKDGTGYFHDGAAAASCQYCKKEDKCLTGDERQKEECLAEYTLAGEACATVQVVKQALSATAEASASHTAEATESASAQAEAKATEKEKAEASAEAWAAADEKVTETETEHAVGEKNGIEVKIPAKASASGEATRSANAKVTAEGSGEASASASGSGSAEGSAKATREVTQKAKASSDGTAVQKSCVSVDQAKNSLGLEISGKVGAVLASKVTAEADRMAFEDAYDKALKQAVEIGLGDAKKLAKELAEAKAAEIAKMKAEAAAKEKAAWVAESNASDEAKAAAQQAAEEKASAEAVEEATEDAEAKAKKLAAKKARESAKDQARAAAKEQAEREASAKAAEKAQPFQDQAQAQAEEASDNVKDGLHGAPQIDQHDREGQ